MSLHKEINFETEVCEHLAAHGWLYVDGDAVLYDRALALFPMDVLIWVQEAQPRAWEALTKNHGVQAGDMLLTRLGMNAAGGLTSLGLGTAAAGGTVQGLYGAVSVAALQEAASSGGETITVVTNLDSAPAAGRALSVATGDGAQALASQASGSTQFTAQIPKALVNLMERTGLATRSYTSMGGTTAQEIKFMPQATQFVTKFFK